ncbi:short-chain dehydrogenase [Pontibacillus halophilus JSM 076056 = DSM 19796]|uniref:Short-chain dehydrogenase n=1 Tax=Pontibacillus halophilus JSM 076056 = DSM 19796 TaxID=1385510 RepID=A0A0A5GD00_9BACI|nr:SDR family oxidoreductase [Pontibacillus halophilus]KGX91081.1 short-chain dehydrogenase [Pontibacillus halophilus JSM 076056 = DSM 19796]
MKTACITGASTGIGRQYAYTLAEKGYNLIIVSRSQDKLDAIADDLQVRYGVKVLVIATDLSERNAPENVYQRIKNEGLQIDLLVNNAGSGNTGKLLESSLEKNHQQVMLNVNAVVKLTHLVLEEMVERQEGDIINVASMASFQPIPYMSIYAATKSFVLSFSEGLHEEYKDDGIRILAVCPGNTETNFFDHAPDSIKVGKMRTAHQVVETSLRALHRNKSSVIDGRSNVMTALLPRLLSRSIVARVSAQLMKKSMKNG